MTLTEQDAERFSDNIIKLRRERRLARAALARRADIGADTLRLIEKGIRAPRLDTLLRLADALEVDPGALLKGLRPKGLRP
ncbi:MAG TPA: helix-turn-helix transcriptional regulator [Solirubrobacterales bacterium]|nr:helix-turn-helix transcriptional regulator [Solirubrobacterales bacterium]